MTDSANAPTQGGTINLSLSAKILILVAISLFLISTATAFIGTVTSRSIAYVSLAREAKTTTLGIAANSAGALRFGKVDSVVEGFDELRDLTNGMFVGAIVFDAEGKVITEMVDTVVASPNALKSLVDDVILSGEFRSSPDGFIAVSPVRMGADKPIVGLIATSWSPSIINQEILESWLKGSVYIVATFVAILAAATLLLQKQIIIPLKTVRDAIKKVSSGNLELKIPFDQRSDEVGQIALSIEDFRQKLQLNAQTDAELSNIQDQQKQVVDSLSDGLKALSKGDLTHLLTKPFPRDHDKLRQDYNETVSSLTSTISGLIDSSAQIRENSNTINSSASDLSLRSNSQAATLEEAVASLTELTLSVQDAAQNAKEADEITIGASNDAKEGVKTVKNAIAAMEGIQEGSQQIEQIISVIQDISFQTNLLALNAGVEAARAGEAGRGFAVVASEVRALAQRSSDAAKQIRDLISGSVDQVAQGSKLVNESGVAFNSIAEQVTNISELVGKIAVNVSDQSSSLTEMNSGMLQLDRVTQQNAAMVEQSTKLSESMLMESNRLSNLVTDFDFKKPTQSIRDLAA